MKRLLIALAASLLICSSLLAHAAVPLPRPAPERSGTFDVPAVQPGPYSFPMAQVDPKFQFPDRTQPQAPQTPSAPSVQTAQNPVVVPAPAGETNIAGWIQTTFMGILTALFGKLALFPKKDKSDGVAALDHGKVSEIVNSVLHPSGTSIIGDPNLRATVDAALLRAVQSGLPGTAIQTGLSLVPGVGPIASQVEPIVRNLVTKILQERAGPGGIVTADPAATGPAATDVLDLLAKLVAQHKPAAA